MVESTKGVLVEPDVEKEFEDPDVLFGKLKGLIQLVTKNLWTSLIVSGGSGTGKTFTVMETLKEEGIQKYPGLILIGGGYISTFSLYQVLFRHRKKGQIIVFDNTDSMWRDKKAACILKSALDAYDDGTLSFSRQRIVSWPSSLTVDVSGMDVRQKKEVYDQLDKRNSDPKNSPKFPSEFEYEGGIIFITNIPINKLDRDVLDCSASIDTTLTVGQMFARMKSILPELGDKTVPLDVKEMILQLVIDEYRKGAIKNVTLFTFIKAESIYKSGMSDWKELIIAC